eukprot:CAMPEP_0119529934 /NCGR_PEP_ID=MMETSP1344-20130328/43844_1 /TAXON_ID=236787 /ORGANISM="Florenciella parvula, Strain CCMP2471" /LENGTH=60 /DNA_ID=CAMNT_0007569691 /DNA_START=344 /DNA_END=522 /DNA_ORIENTATION=+
MTTNASLMIISPKSMKVRFTKMVSVVMGGTPGIAKLMFGAPSLSRKRSTIATHPRIDTAS